MEGKREAPRAAGLSPAGAIVRRHDRERFLAALAAPEPAREALFALYAFNFEIARTREVVSEPMLGQIRLQWWREAIDGIYEGHSPRRHEVVEPLAAAIRAHGLERQHFTRLIDARESDLAGEPPTTMASLEAYCEASAAELVLLALEALGAESDAAAAVGRHVGVAWALVGLIRALPFHARAKRLYIPEDVVAATGLRRGDVFELRATPALVSATHRLAEAARAHLAEARSQRRRVPRNALPALLVAPLADAHLRRLARAGNNPFDPRLARRDPLAPLRVFAAALARRF